MRAYEIIFRAAFEHNPEVTEKAACTFTASPVTKPSWISDFEP
jgi:hypothetical protein